MPKNSTDQSYKRPKYNAASRAEALSLAEQSLRLYRELEDAQGVAFSLAVLGRVTLLRGEHERAATLLEESVARFRTRMDLWAIACVLAHRAMVSLDEGDYGLAGTQLMESLTHLRDLCERWQAVHTLELVARLAA